MIDFLEPVSTHEGMATTEPYRLSRPTGEDKMLLVSVGTGGEREREQELNAAGDALDLQCQPYSFCFNGGGLA